MMKKYLITILGLFLLTNCVSATYEKYVRNYQPTAKVIYRQIYNPYSTYYTPYQYSKVNYNNAKRIQRLNRIRRLNRMIRTYNSLTWDFTKKGSLTGYSAPISDDVYQRMGIDPYDKTRIQDNSNNRTQSMELFSTPQTNEKYTRRGVKGADLGGISGKTGVRVIYD